MTDHNEVIRDALEIREEYWPYLHLLSPQERYMIRKIDAGLRYIAEMLKDG